MTGCIKKGLALKPRTSMTRQQARRRSSSSGLGLSSPVPRSSNSRMGRQLQAHLQRCDAPAQLRHLA